MVKKAVVGAGAFLLTMVLTTSNAFAWYCYNESRSTKGAQAVDSHSQSFGSIGDFLAEIGLCPDGIDYVYDGVAALGLDPQKVLINHRAVMAGGLEQKDTGLLRNGKGIEHLTFEDFTAVEALVGEAFAACPAG